MVCCRSQQTCSKHAGMPVEHSLLCTTSRGGCKGATPRKARPAALLTLRQGAASPRATAYVESPPSPVSAMKSTHSSWRSLQV